MSAPEQITFVDARPRVGLVMLRTCEEETRMTFSPPGPEGKPVEVITVTRARSVRREEVVAVRGAVAERLRVTFIEDGSFVDTNGVTEHNVGPLVGSTFIVERKADAAPVAVFEARGAPASFGDAAQVAAQYRQFGQAGDSAAGRLPFGPQQVGQRSPEIAESLVAGLSAGSTITNVAVREATLAEIRAVSGGVLHGLYRVAIDTSAVADGTVVTMHLTGTLLLRDSDGALLEVRLKGRVESTPEEDADGAVDAEIPAGSGEYKLTQTLVTAMV